VANLFNWEQAQDILGNDAEQTPTDSQIGAKRTVVEACTNMDVDGTEVQPPSKKARVKAEKEWEQEIVEHTQTEDLQSEVEELLEKTPASKEVPPITTRHYPSLVLPTPLMQQGSSPASTVQVQPNLHVKYTGTRQQSMDTIKELR